MSEYNPADIEPFKGRSFMTNSGSCYSISEDGRFLGRDSIGGAKVLYVAGVNLEGYWTLAGYLGEFNKHNFDRTILEIGERPRAGLHLVVSLTDESVEKVDRIGFITSKIKIVEKTLDMEIETEVEEELLEE